MLETLPLAQALHDLILFGPSLGRNEHENGLAHGLLRRITKDPLRGRVPGFNPALQIFADDGVIRGLEHRREVSVRFFSSLALRDVRATADVAEEGAIGREA